MQPRRTTAFLPLNAAADAVSIYAKLKILIKILLKALYCVDI